MGVILSEGTYTHDWLVLYEIWDVGLYVKRLFVFENKHCIINISILHCFSCC